MTSLDSNVDTATEKALIFDRKIHTTAKLGIFQQSVKICYILLEMSYKVLKVVKIGSCQNLRVPKLKITKIESCQKFNLPKLKVAKIENC